MNYKKVKSMVHKVSKQKKKKKKRKIYADCPNIVVEVI